MYAEIINYKDYDNRPSGGDFMTVKSSSVITEDSGKSKVSDLEMTCTTDEKVGWLQITVHDVVVMAISHAFQQHQHVAFYLPDFQKKSQDNVMKILEILYDLR